MQQPKLWHTVPTLQTWQHPGACLPASHDSQANDVLPILAVTIWQRSQLVLGDFADQSSDVKGIEGGALCSKLIEDTAQRPAGGTNELS